MILWGGLEMPRGSPGAGEMRLEKAVSLEIKVPDQGLPSHPPPGDTTIFWVWACRTLPPGDPYLSAAIFLPETPIFLER